MLLRGQLGFEKWSNIDPNSLNKEAQKQQILHFLGGLRSIFLMSILLLDFYHIKGFEMKLFINVHNTFVTLSSISRSDQKPSYRPHPSWFQSNFDFDDMNVRA